jgi:hypothetical protein
MNAFGPTFQLPAVVTRFICDPEAWSREEDAPLVTHHPTHCVFEVALPGNMDDLNFVDAFSFGARLIHVCDGNPLPTREQQRALAHEALTFWALEQGLLSPRVLSLDPQLPAAHHEHRSDGSAPPAH